MEFVYTSKVSKELTHLVYQFFRVFWSSCSNMDDCERGIFFRSFSPITAKHQNPSTFDLMLVEDFDSIIGKVAYRL